MKTSTKRIALITGANKGIGYEVARGLAASGCGVLLGARNSSLGQAAASRLAAEGRDAHFIEIDLDAPETIAAAAKKIDTDFGRLDILINNAGMVADGDGPPTATSTDAIERALKVNFVATVAVTQAMLPLLHRSSSARIVNVSSGLGSLTRSGNPELPSAAHKYLGYAASKAALNMLTVQLASELAGTAIKVNSACPGYTATDLNHHRGTQTVEEGTVEILRLALLPDDGPSGAFSDRYGSVPW